MAASRHVGFDITRNSAIRSADPENQNQIWSVSDYSLRRSICVSWGHIWNPILGERDRRGSAIVPSKERWWLPAISSPLWPLRYL